MKFNGYLFALRELNIVSNKEYLITLLLYMDVLRELRAEEYDG